MEKKFKKRCNAVKQLIAIFNMSIIFINISIQENKKLFAYLEGIQS